MVALSDGQKCKDACPRLGSGGHLYGFVPVRALFQWVSA